MERPIYSRLNAALCSRMRHALLLLALVVGLAGTAQPLKLYIKPFVGGHYGIFNQKLENVQKESTYGYQGGFAFRVCKGKFLLEPGFMFLKDYFRLNDTLVNEFIQIGINDPQIRYNTFEFPLVIGYKFIDKELFKWFAAGGLSMNVSIKSNILDGRKKVLKLKAKELGLSNPRFSMRMGTGFDIAFLTIGMYYNLGLNSATRTVYRTQTHSFECNLGILF